MSLLGIWRNRAERAQAATHWVGVHCRGDHLFLAHVAQRADAKPRIAAVASFDGPQALDAMLVWQRQRQHSGAPAFSSLLLATADYQLLVLDAPAVPAAERSDALRWGLKDLLDGPVEEAAIDCIEVPAAMRGDAAQRLLTVVSKKATVREWMRRYRDARVPLSAIDVPELALRNLAVLSAGLEARAFLHLGLDKTHLILVWQGELCSFRELDISGTQYFHASEDERAVLADRLALEVQRTADSFTRQFHSADLSGLDVSSVGGLDDLLERLSNLVSLRVADFRVEERIDIDGVACHPDMTRRIDFTYAIGAALRQERNA